MLFQHGEQAVRGEALLLSQFFDMLFHVWVAPLFEEGGWGWGADMPHFLTSFKLCFFSEGWD